MKKQANKQAKAVLKVLVPDHVKRTTDNSKWCGTTRIFKKGKKEKTNRIKDWL